LYAPGQGQTAASDPLGSRERGIDCALSALALRCAAGCSGRCAACASSSPAARFEPSVRELS